MRRITTTRTVPFTSHHLPALLLLVATTFTDTDADEGEIGLLREARE